MKDTIEFEKDDSIKDINFIKRLKTIDMFNGSEVEEVISNPLTPESKYIVDDSGFIPISEAIKQLNNVDVSASEIEETYDFPNGVDTGKRIPYTRRHDVKDITEISTAIINDTKQIVSEIEKGRNKKADRDNFEKSLKSVSVPTENKSE